MRDATDGEGRRKEKKKRRVRVKCPGISDQESGVLGDREMRGGIDWKLQCGQSVLVSHYQGSKLITEQTQTRANYLARVLAYVPRQERLGAHECARNHAHTGNKRWGGVSE